MSIFQGIILGIIQGLTEFLPVSSSAHLVLVPYLLQWRLDADSAFVFDVIVQLGTLAAVIIYFWKDLIAIIQAMLAALKAGQPFRDGPSLLGWWIVLATIPAGLAGLLLKSKVEAAFASPLVTAIFLFVVAIIMTLAEGLGKQNRSLEAMRLPDAVTVGLFQALAIFPGISRSGATISGGLLRGLNRDAAARFSFLMSVPIMLAAGALAVKDLAELPNLAQFLPVMLLGFLVAGVVGYFAIRWLLGYLRKNSLIPFALYCALLSIVTIFVISGRG